LLLGLVVAGVMASAIILQLLSRDRRQARTVSRLEGKLDALVKHAGVQFDPYADVAPAVLDALRRGKKMTPSKSTAPPRELGFRTPRSMCRSCCAEPAFADLGISRPCETRSVI
jgi:hypothetical protein